MQGVNVADTRTIAFVAHSGSGKTSLIEALLYKAGATTRLGNVANGTSVMDYNPEEKERKVTIYAKPVHYKSKGKSIFVIDTPGYGDFFGDVVSSLRVVDSAIIVIDGVSGIQVGTQRVWRKAAEEGIPRAIVVNRLDKENSDFYKVVESIQKIFSKECVPILIPVGSESNFKEVVNLINEGVTVPDEVKDQYEQYRNSLIEAVAETDDALLEKYLEGGTLSADELLTSLKKGIVENKIVPILCTAATKEIGTVELMDVIEKFLPSPADRGEIKATEDKTCKPDPNAPYSAFVFKTITDPYVGQVTYFRVYSGTIKSDSSVYNVNKESKEKLGQLTLLLGKQQQPITESGPGDIVAVTKLKNTSINDTFSDQANKIKFPPINFPKPSISFAVKPHSRGDEEKIGIGLHRLAAEDPTFELHRDKETHELVISGLGDLHLDIMLAKLKAKFGVEVDKSTPKIAYKETITAKGDAKYRHKKQSGGAGQFAEVWLRVEPMERGKGFEFVDEIVGGSIPAQFVMSCEKGIKGAMDTGFLAGFPVVDVRAIVYDGKTHPVDSKDIAFQVAARNGFKDACQQAKPVLLEPVMHLEVCVDSEFMGDVTGDLNGKRGRVQGMDQLGDMQIVKAQVPMSELSRYSTDLKSMTGGRGSFTLEFSHYEEVPARLAQDIINKAKTAKEEAANK